MTMIMLLTRKSAFAAALCIAAGSGSLVAMTKQAKAQSAPAAIAAASPTAPSVTLTSTALIERKTVDAMGKETIAYKVPSEVQVVPGDKVVFKLIYTNKGKDPATGFRATNPMPAPIQFASVREDWAEVSVDGGVTWGKLNDLIVPQATVSEITEGTAPASTAAASPAPVAAQSSTRSAVPSDVTHVRWVVAGAIAPGASGDMSYVGIIK